jgi:hypothetical protein
MTAFRDKRFRLVIQAVYYLLIIAVLVVMYGKGDFSTPPFIYQNF